MTTWGASWVRWSLGFLAFAACSSGGGGPGVTDASGDDIGGTGVAADAPEADAAAPADTGAARPWPTGKYISVDEVYARLQAQDPEMLLVNVVDEEYYNLGFIAGSLKIPWDTLAGRLDELDPARHIVLYCRRGVRSESAYTTLIENGFTLVWVMEGGIEAWIAAGYPVVPE